jgi:hypothetical protein
LPVYFSSITHLNHINNTVFNANSAGFALLNYCTTQQRQ